MKNLLGLVIISIFGVCQPTKTLAAISDPEKKPWTILVFLNADNNLEDYGFEDIREMEKVGSNANVNIVVQMDPISPKGTQRVYVEKALHSYTGGLDSFQSPVVVQMPEQDMGDYRTLVDFVTWGMENYPAEHYMVIVWNHGSGWDKEKNSNELFKGISYDDSSGNHITTNQLSLTFDDINAATGNRVDIIGFDACLMSMLEVADSLSGMVDFMVASQENEPGDGYPYDDFLKIFEGNTPVKPSALAKHLVKVYGKSYESGGSQNPAPSSSGSDSEYGSWYGNGAPRVPQVTNSAIDLSRMELVKRRLDTWLETLQKDSKISKQDLTSAVGDTMDYSVSSYKDLGNYIRNIMAKIAVKSESESDVNANRFSNSGFVGQSLSLLRAIQDAVIENYNSPSFQKSTGLSIWLPYSSWDSTFGGKSYKYKRGDYLSLKWSMSTTWVKYLDYLMPGSVANNSNNQSSNNTEVETTPVVVPPVEDDSMGSDTLILPEIEPVTGGEEILPPADEPAETVSPI